MSTKQAAEYLGLSHFYLRNLRHGLHEHNGPKYTIQKHPRGYAAIYLKEDLDLWISSHVFRKRKTLNVKN